jgi:branched-chain amino acid transport system permease protein
MKQRAWIWVLALVLIFTSPFIWTDLQYNFQTQTVRDALSWQHGVSFFYGMIPMIGIALAVAVLVLIWNWIPKPQIAVIQKISRYAWIPALLLLLTIPAFTSIKNLSLFSQLGIYMILALGLNIAVGQTGLLVLGYAGFFMFGAYVFAVAQSFLPWVSWWMALIPAFVFGMIMGVLVGLPCLRLRGDYLAIVTLGFGEALREAVRNLGFTGGDSGLIISRSAKFDSIGPLSVYQVSYFVILFTIGVAAFVIYRLTHSKLGRAWEAIREDELVASCLGVPVVKCKLQAFALSAGYAAVAGVLYAAHVGFIDPMCGALDQSVLVLSMIILGGLGSIPGALLGSALLFLIPALLRDYVPQLSDYRLFSFGMIMVAMMLLRPQGLLGKKAEGA